MGSLFFDRLKNRLLRVKLNGRDIPPLIREHLCALDHLRLNRPADEFTFVAVDIETTGGDRTRDRMVSIGAVKMENGRVRLGQTFHSFVNPGRDISPESICVHGICPDMVQCASPDREVLSDFLCFLGNGILIAHHAAFDLNFINRLMKLHYGVVLQNLVLDTFFLSRYLLMLSHYGTLRRHLKLPGPGIPPGLEPAERRFDLDTVTGMLGIPVYHRHTALGDALAAAMILQQIMAAFSESGNGTLATLIQHGKLQS
jgi:DNA polymerase III subunit epsilon